MDLLLAETNLLARSEPVVPNALNVVGLLARRPATALDVDFLRAVFAESRPELALVPEPARDQLIGMQLPSQLEQYRRDAPDAIDWILELDDGNGAEPIGRCYLWQGPSEHRLLDLAIAER